MGDLLRRVDVARALAAEAGDGHDRLTLPGGHHDCGAESLERGPVEGVELGRVRRERTRATRKRVQERRVCREGGWWRASAHEERRERRLVAAIDGNRLRPEDRGEALTAHPDQLLHARRSTEVAEQPL